VYSPAKDVKFADWFGYLPVFDAFLTASMSSPVASFAMHGVGVAILSAHER
jgi:hypothetical protein